MNLRNIGLVLAVTLMLSVIAIPMAETDAAIEDEIVIQIPELNYDSWNPTVSPQPVELKNNGSGSYIVYISNNSTSDIHVEFEATKTKHVSVEGTNIMVKHRDMDKNVPTNGQETLVFKADGDAPTGTYTIDVKFSITTLGVQSPKMESSITFNVEVTSGYYSSEAYNSFFGLFPNTFPEPYDEAWFPALVTIFIYMVLGWALCVVIIPAILHAFKKKGRLTSDEKKKLTKSVTKMVEIIILVYSVNECAQILGLGPSVCHMLSGVSTFIYVCVAAAIAWRIYVVVVKSILDGVSDAEVSGLDSSLLPLFKMLGKIAISVVSAAAILAAFGVDMAGILMSAGVITLGITLGAQNTLNQFFSGIVLLSTRPFKKGDFVQINGDIYTVQKVKLMFTEFGNWDKDKTITMPNNVVSGATIVNLTHSMESIRIFIYMSVAYEANQTKAKELLLKAANMHPHVIQDELHSPPNVRLTNFQDSGIEYRLACYVDSFDNSQHYAGQIREIIFKLFKDEDVEIPYNKMEITLHQPCDGRKREDDNLD